MSVRPTSASRRRRSPEVALRTTRRKTRHSAVEPALSPPGRPRLGSRDGSSGRGRRSPAPSTRLHTRCHREARSGSARCRLRAAPSSSRPGKYAAHGPANRRAGAGALRPPHGIDYLTAWTGDQLPGITPSGTEPEPVPESIGFPVIQGNPSPGASQSLSGEPAPGRRSGHFERCRPSSLPSEHRGFGSHQPLRRKPRSGLVFRVLGSSAPRRRRLGLAALCTLVPDNVSSQAVRGTVAGGSSFESALPRQVRSHGDERLDPIPGERGHRR